MSDIVVRVKSEAGDFFRILFRQSRNRLILAGVFVILLTGLLFTFFVFSKPKDPSNDKRPGAYVALTLLPIIVIGSFYFGIRRRANKLAKTITEETEIIFSDEGVKSSNSKVTTEVKWGLYQKVIETPSDFIFFPQSNIFFGIPKRCFDSGEQISQLKEIIKVQMGERAYLRK